MKLIFIHGSGGSKEAWYYQTRHFPDAEAINLPGHPQGELRTSIDDYVEWLRGYIHEKDYSDVVLAGHSLGGGIVLLYALKYPQDLKGIIPIGSGARLRVHPMYLEMLEKAIDDPSALEEFLKIGWELIDAELVEVLRRRAYENGPGAFLNDMHCCDRFDIMDRVQEIKLPTLALCGSEDIMTPPKYSKYLADRIEGAREVIVSGGTHMVFAEKPEEVNKAIKDFLESLLR
ncbi:MAG: alpha/beta hydrolase [Dehalococcoidia bacterium]|nr:MAG: alpha/beta hydrolase [Dehalococcoidia bacterium]